MSGQQAQRLGVTGLEKVPTLVSGVDEVLKGGVPAGRATLVSGGPGSGKTVLGLEFVYRGALAGEAGIFVTFEESAEAVRRNAAAMGWDLGELEAAGKLFVFQAEIPRDAVLSGDFDITGLLAIMGGKARGITCVFTNQGSAELDDMAFSGLGISSLMDTLVTLHYRETEEGLERELLVVKSRGSEHSRRRHRFEVTGSGLVFEDSGAGQGKGVRE